MMLLGTHPRSIISRSTRSKVLEQARSITARFPKVTLNFGWLPFSEVPADLNSKIHVNLLEKMNSAIWRQGPPVFQNEEVLLSKTFIRYNRDTKTLDFRI